MVLANASMAWLRENFWSVSSAAKLKLNMHLTHRTYPHPNFFLWRFLKYDIYLRNPHTIVTWKAATSEKNSSDDLGRMCTCYKQFCIPHSKLPLTERWTSGAYTLGHLLTFLIYIRD